MIANTKNSLHYLLLSLQRRAHCLSMLIKVKHCLGTRMTIFILVPFLIDISLAICAAAEKTQRNACFINKI